MEPELQDSEPMLVALGDAVRSARTANGWSQTELAKRANMDRSYLAGLEQGARNPSFRVLDRVSQALGVALWLLFREAADAVGQDRRRRTR